MAIDLERAKKLLHIDEYTCVLCKGNMVYTSSKTGVAPLLEWIEAGIDFNDFSAADKIVGKAAALLFVSRGIKAIYSPVMSETAKEIFIRYGIEFEYSDLVPKIFNRKGRGQCPMEQAVSLIDDPSRALKALQHKLLVLSTKNNI